jgi:hypothetical protein
MGQLTLHQPHEAAPTIPVRFGSRRLVVALAEPDGTALTSNVDDLEALAMHANGVSVAKV